MKLVTSFFSKAFIVIMAFITLFPFVYMILASFMSFAEVQSIPPVFIPENFNFENFREAFYQAPFVRYFFNTILTASISTLGTVVTTVLASFALVKYNFRGKEFLLLFMASLLMIPYEVTVFTNYHTIAKLGLLDTYTALIIPSMASVFYIFYLKEYLANISMSYYNAAKVSGCSDLQYIIKIMIPMAKPALYTMTLINFICGCTSFIWPLLVTNSKEMRLLNNGLSAFASEAGVKTQLQMAASTITIIPIVIIYIIFRKQIIKGVVKSGIKG